MLHACVVVFFGDDGDSSQAHVRIALRIMCTCRVIDSVLSSVHVLRCFAPRVHINVMLLFDHSSGNGCVTIRAGKIPNPLVMSREN